MPKQIAQSSSAEILHYLNDLDYGNYGMFLVNFFLVMQFLYHQPYYIPSELLSRISFNEHIHRLVQGSINLGRQGLWCHSLFFCGPAAADSTSCAHSHSTYSIPSRGVKVR